MTSDEIINRLTDQRDLCAHREKLLRKDRDEGLKKINRLLTENHLLKREVDVLRDDLNSLNAEHSRLYEVNDRLRSELSEANQRLDIIANAFQLDERAGAYLRPDND